MSRPATARPQSLLLAILAHDQQRDADRDVVARRTAARRYRMGAGHDQASDGPRLWTDLRLRHADPRELLRRALLPLVYVFVLRPGPIDLRRMSGRYICYAAGFLLPFASWMVRNSLIDTRMIGPDGINQLAMIFRTQPVDPSSPFRSAAQIFSDALANIQDSVIYQLPKSIVPGLWTDGFWNGLGAWSGPVAALLSLALVWLSCCTARNLPIMLMYGSMAALNILFAVGGLAGLWVPVTCLLALSLPIGAEGLPLFRNRRVRNSFAGLTVTALAVSLVSYAIHHEEHPYRDPNYAALASLFSDIRHHVALKGNVLTPSPQAFELYTGFSAPMSRPASASIRITPMSFCRPWSGRHSRFGVRRSLKTASGASSHSSNPSRSPNFVRATIAPFPRSRPLP